MYCIPRIKKLIQESETKGVSDSIINSSNTPIISKSKTTSMSTQTTEDTPNRENENIANLTNIECQTNRIEKEENEITREINYTTKPFYNNGKDQRPYIKVTIKGKEVEALVDSGAQCSVLGKNLINDISEWGKHIQPSKFTISTVYQTKHEVIGSMDIEYTFNGETKIVPTIIVPVNTKKLILGIDFMKIFNITLHIPTSNNKICNIETNIPSTTYIHIDSFSIEDNLEIDEINKISTAEDPLDCKDDLIPKKQYCVTVPHVLNKRQQRQLDDIL